MHNQIVCPKCDSRELYVVTHELRPWGPPEDYEDLESKAPVIIAADSQGEDRPPTFRCKDPACYHEFNIPCEYDFE